MIARMSRSCEIGHCESTVHIEGILHLAALSVGISIAYVGLDRIRPSEEKLEKEISLVKEKVYNILAQMEVMPSTDGTINPVYKHLDLFVLYHVAEIKVKKGWRKVAHALNKHHQLPLLNYFRHRHDIMTVTILGAISTILFLYLTAHTIWKHDFPVNKFLLRISFVWYVVSLLWILITVFAAHKLFRIENVCNSLIMNVNKYFEQTAEASLKASKNKPVASPPDETGDPKPPDEADDPKSY